MKVIINEQTARTAQNMNSFRDYQENSATNQYLAECEEFRKCIEKVEEKYQYQIIKLVDRFETKLGNYLNDYYRNEASCPSIMISGGGNFNTRKKERQNQRRDTLYNEYKEIQELKEKILNFEPKLEKDDEIIQIQKEIEGMKIKLETMKKINAHYKKFNNLDEFEGLTEATKRAIINGLDWRNKPFPDFALTSIREKIKGRQEKLEKLSKPVEVLKEESKESEIKEGIKLVENAEIDRLQLLFDYIPSVEVRTLLKQNGFRWSPTNKAWQRQLTSNAKYAAKQVLAKI